LCANLSIGRREGRKRSRDLSLEPKGISKMTHIRTRHRRGFTFTKGALVAISLLYVRSAQAEDAASKATETKQESPIKIERDALYEQDSLENARAGITENTIARKERFELKRAHHQHQMDKLQGQPEDSNARKLLGRRVFFPSLAAIGSGLGALGLWGPSILAFSASEQSSYVAFRPRIDVKLDSGLTVGGNVLFLTQTIKYNSAFVDDPLATSKSVGTLVSVEPRIGYMFHLGQSGLLLWPKVSVYAEYTLMRSVQTSQRQGSIEQSTPSSAFGGGGDVSLLVPLSSRAYVDFTPSFNVKKTWVHAEPQDTNFTGGIAAGLGVAF
jgi:hypothetical protein